MTETATVPTLSTVEDAHALLRELAESRRRRAESMSTDTTTPEPCTTWYGNRRHYSIDLHDDEWHPGKGRRGKSLCSSAGNPVGVNAQDWIDAMADQYPHLAKIRVDDLPVCKKCVRKAGIAE